MQNNPIIEYYNKIQLGEIVACDKIKRLYKRIVQDITDATVYFYDSKRIIINR